MVRGWPDFEPSLKDPQEGGVGLGWGWPRAPFKAPSLFWEKQTRASGEAHWKMEFHISKVSLALGRLSV